MSAAIKSRDDLSFTMRDVEGRLINWPRNNPGVAADWQKGIDFFECEVRDLANHDETEAFNAIRFALVGMGGRTTNLELGFIERVALAAMVGLRALRDGAQPFTPAELD
ncbi:hypothetical protein I5P86_27265 [Pseudomonas glycinae]|uniref:hypothetical protein n=1 Tax=Pseudomonas glycinae TaxID=1785145 RepID=UPI0018DA16C7|nr:hypothetical protein [Pseudomonas glycinae]MBH3408770.1 hypothetical protein [Pseudomonas glycinae]